MLYYNASFFIFHQPKLSSKIPALGFPLKHESQLTFNTQNIASSLALAAPSHFVYKQLCGC